MGYKMIPLKKETFFAVTNLKSQVEQEMERIITWDEFFRALLVITDRESTKFLDQLEEILEE